jgi:hypothetical protein
MRLCGTDPFIKVMVNRLILANGTSADPIKDVQIVQTQ